MKYLINNIITDWKQFIDDEFNKTYMNDIDNFLNNSTQKIYPDKENIFRCFNYFNIRETRVVIFGQDPYHNQHQANGLAFSVNENVKTPPSLVNIFKKLDQELNIKRSNPDLQDWAYQGVLLLNTCLTVFENNPTSNSNIGWNHFVSNVIKRLNKNDNSIVFVLMGNHAKKLKQMISNKHKIIQLGHPSPLSAYKTDFFIKPLFKEINEFLNYNNYNSIKWGK